MFNLLRERVRRKRKSNKNNKDDNVPKTTATNKQTINVESATYYRQFKESDKHQTTAVAAAAAAANVGVSITDTKPATTTRRRRKTGGAEVIIEQGNVVEVEAGRLENVGKIYFEQCRNLAETSDNGEDITDQYMIEKLNEEETAVIDGVRKETQYERERQRQRRHEQQKVEDVSNDLMVCGFSHNEPAEWQRRVLTIGENNEEILTNRNKTTTTTTAAHVINNKINNNNLKAFSVKENQLEHVENKQLTTKTTTTTTAEPLNEVKYRNLDKSISRNEAKRQSRLSFTLAGINFGKKTKGVDERKTTTTTTTVEICNNNINNNNSNNINDTCKSERNKLGPLQKSREYLNGLFMARGRHHNRHQRQQQQQQQQQQLTQDKCKEDAANNAAKASAEQQREEKIVHLESNGDRATDFTNSYQIPLSKNSMLDFQTITEAHTSGRERTRQRQPERESLRSNSATILRAHSASPLPSNKRSRSVTFNEEVELLGEQTHLGLNNGNDWLSQTAHLAQHAAVTAHNSQLTHGDGTLNSEALPTANHQYIQQDSSKIANNAQFIEFKQIDKQSNMGQTQTKADTAMRDFRESHVHASSPINVQLPTITVADYSETLSSAATTPVDQEVFYDIDNNVNKSTKMKVDNAVAADEHDHDQYSKWQTPNNGLLAQSQMRHSYVKLEDVREEDEDAEQVPEENDDEDDDEEEEEESSVEEPLRSRHLDNELYNSSERSPLKSSDTTLSGSPSDSGIGTDSQPTTPLNIKTRDSPNSHEALNQQQKLKQQIKQQYSFMSFVRDGNSTDCEETQLPRDDIELDLADDILDDVDDDDPYARLVCIESISLPDVVVESTTVSSSASSTLSSSGSTGEHIININGATGNSIGNVHFIPIHVEGATSTGSSSAAKRRSVDDSVIGGGSIEITEDDSIMNGFAIDNRHAEKLK